MRGEENELSFLLERNRFDGCIFGIIIFPSVQKRREEVKTNWFFPRDWDHRVEMQESQIGYIVKY